jgi:hypothetical protein
LQNFEKKSAPHTKQCLNTYINKSSARQLYDNEQYNALGVETLPCQKCHGPRLLQLTYRVLHPPQQIQMFDSKLDLGS